jgi:hypothetical protein
MARFSYWEGLGEQLRKFNSALRKAPPVETPPLRREEAADAAADTERIRRIVRTAGDRMSDPETGQDQNERQSPTADPQVPIAETPAPVSEAPRPSAPTAPPESESRPAPTLEADRTRRLWGREFSVAELGLSEQEIVSFVEELLKQNRELKERADSTGVMGDYVQRVMGELQQVEETIRVRAQMDAEAEAARIVADAQRQAHDTIVRAQTEAIEMAQKQADAILVEARRKAEIAEGQIRIQAQLMLSRARDQVEHHIQKEGEIVYNRMLASITQIVEEAQRLSIDWKRQTSNLWQGSGDALSLGRGDLTSSPTIQETLGAAEASWPPVRSEDEPPVHAEGVDDVARSDLYKGEVEVALAPPVDAAALARLYGRLLAMPDLQIVRTVDTADSGTSIRVLLERPQPLVKQLLEIPEVRAASGYAEDPAGGRIAITLEG